MRCSLILIGIIAYSPTVDATSLYLKNETDYDKLWIIGNHKCQGILSAATIDLFLEKGQQDYFFCMGPIEGRMIIQAFEGFDYNTGRAKWRDVTNQIILEGEGGSTDLHDSATLRISTGQIWKLKIKNKPTSNAQAPS